MLGAARSLDRLAGLPDSHFIDEGCGCRNRRSGIGRKKGVIALASQCKTKSVTII